MSQLAQEHHRTGMLRCNIKGAFQSSRKRRLIRIVVVAWQNGHDGVIIVLFDAQKAVQYRRRRAFVRWLYNSLRRPDPQFLKIEDPMAPC